MISVDSREMPSAMKTWMREVIDGEMNKLLALCKLWFFIHFSTRLLVQLTRREFATQAFKRTSSQWMNESHHKSWKDKKLLERLELGEGKKKIIYDFSLWSLKWIEVISTLNHILPFNQIKQQKAFKRIYLSSLNDLFSTHFNASQITKHLTESFVKELEIESFFGVAIANLFHFFVQCFRTACKNAYRLSTKKKK